MSIPPPPLSTPAVIPQGAELQSNASSPVPSRSGLTPTPATPENQTYLQATLNEIQEIANDVEMQVCAIYVLQDCLGCPQHP